MLYWFLWIWIVSYLITCILLFLITYFFFFLFTRYIQFLWSIIIDFSFISLILFDIFIFFFPLILRFFSLFLLHTHTRWFLPLFHFFLVNLLLNQIEVVAFHFTTALFICSIMFIKTLLWFILVVLICETSKWVWIKVPNNQLLVTNLNVFTILFLYIYF